MTNVDQKGQDWLRAQAAECHRLAKARGKYPDPWLWTTAIDDTISELSEWAEAMMREQIYGDAVYPHSRKEYGDLLHVVLSLGHQMCYDVAHALADAQKRNRLRIEEGACPKTRLRDALRELVALHDEVKHTDPVDYERRKPLAWQAAREALEGGGDS